MLSIRGKGTTEKLLQLDNKIRWLPPAFIECMECDHR